MTTAPAQPELGLSDAQRRGVAHAIAMRARAAQMHRKARRREVAAAVEAKRRELMAQVWRLEAWQMRQTTSPAVTA